MRPFLFFAATVLAIVTIASAVLGGLLLHVASNALHELEAGLLILIAVVALTGAVVALSLAAVLQTLRDR